ncbi:MAG TPA: sulfur transferase domain-containing protein, partial [Gemmatimonadaceae bacterium]|nr:sulfur transferase domain-containing protein [Gemmatimonadaceae bacterium]
RTLPYGDCLRDDIATAGQLSAAQLAAAAQAGVRTILDLRPPFEPRGYDEAAAVKAAGMAYVIVPVTPVTLDDAAFAKVLEVVRDPARRPVLVHCATANRVGGLLIPYLMIDEKMSQQDAVRRAQEIGLRSADYARMAIDYARRHGAEG